MLVKYGRSYVYHSVEGVQPGDSMPQQTFNQSAIINTELEILKSRELAGEVVAAMGIEKLFPDMARSGRDREALLPYAVGAFGGMLNAYHVNGSSVIGVDIEHTDPVAAVEAADILLQKFKLRHLEIFKNPQLAFLEQQVKGYHDDLERAEKAKKEFLRKNNIVDLKEQKKSLIYNFDNLRALLLAEEQQLVFLREKARGLKAEFAKIPQKTMLREENSHGGDTATASRLLELKLKGEELAKKYPDTNRLVIENREKIALAEKYMSSRKNSWRKAVTSGKDPSYAGIEQQLLELRPLVSAQEKKYNLLKEQVESKREQLQHVVGLEVELDSLDRQIKERKTVYWEFFNKLELSRVEEAMDREQMVNIVVIEKPSVPLRPFKPRKKVSLLIGLVLSTACSLFFCLVSEYLGNRKGEGTGGAAA
jgi:uncharacterized protein involved in exopolysaccharide biosynthesis